MSTLEQDDAFQPPPADEPAWTQRRRLRPSSSLDITAMIDLTFLLLIFFLVTSSPDVQRALDLPPARHGTAVDPRGSILISLADAGDRLPPLVYLADGREGEPLAGPPAQQEAALREAVVREMAAGRTNVLVKAERGIPHREVARIARILASVPGTRLHWGVLERGE